MRNANFQSHESLSFLRMILLTMARPHNLIPVELQIAQPTCLIQSVAVTEWIFTVCLKCSRNALIEDSEISSNCNTGRGKETRKGSTYLAARRAARGAPGVPSKPGVLARPKTRYSAVLNLTQRNPSSVVTFNESVILCNILHVCTSKYMQ